MYMLDLSDILFFIKSIKQPSNHFNIFHYVSFSSSNTRSSSKNKLRTYVINILQTTNNTTHILQDLIPRLWNYLPPVDLDQPFITIKTQIYDHLLNHFKSNFNQLDPCTFHYRCTCSNCYTKTYLTNLTDYTLLLNHYIAMQLCTNLFGPLAQVASRPSAHVCCTVL